MKIKKQFIARLAVYTFPIIIVIIAIWQLFFENSVLIPPPTKIFSAMKEWINTGEFWRDLKASFWRVFLGFTIGSFSGIVLGFLTGRINKLNLMFSPILNVVRAFPPVAILPVFITFWGIEDFSKIFSIAFACIFPLWVNTHIGANSIPIEYIRSAKLAGVSFFKIIFPASMFKYGLPASLSPIFAGLRVSVALSFIMLYVSELAGASSGLGYQISSSHLAYRMDLMFAALLFLGVSAAIADFGLIMLVKWIFPWTRLKNNV